MSNSPKKRSMKDLSTISPNKCTNTRKPVLVEIVAVVDGTVAVLIAKVEGRMNAEPFTNPARMAILNREDGVSNKLIEAGFFMVASNVIDECTDIARRTNRGYDYKAFVASVDRDLTRSSFVPLKMLGQVFCDISI